MAFAVKSGASDVLLVVGSAPVLRVNGALTSTTRSPLEADEVRNLVLPLLDESQVDRKSVV